MKDKNLTMPTWQNSYCVRSEPGDCKVIEVQFLLWAYADMLEWLIGLVANQCPQGLGGSIPPVGVSSHKIVAKSASFSHWKPGFKSRWEHSPYSLAAKDASSSYWRHGCKSH